MGLDGLSGDVSASTGGSIALDATVSGNVTPTDLFTEANSETVCFSFSNIDFLRKHNFI